MLPVPSHFFPFHTQQAFPYHIPAVIAIRNIDLPYLCSPTLVPTITVSPGPFWLILAPLQPTKNPEEVLKPWINLYLTTYLVSSVWERERKGKKERKKEERKKERKRKKIISRVYRYKEGEGSGELPECGGSCIQSGHTRWLLLSSLLVLSNWRQQIRQWALVLGLERPGRMDPLSFRRQTNNISNPPAHSPSILHTHWRLWQTEMASIHK